MAKILARVPTLRLCAVSACLVLGFSMQAAADCGFKTGDSAAGDKVYHQTCVACHGEDGRGTVPGAPDFNKKGGVLGKPHEVLSQHIKNGFKEAGHPLAMPAKGGNPGLSDDDIANVHAYLHKRYGCG
jgi:mono/diheme cytochrome c family protein